MTAVTYSTVAGRTIAASNCAPPIPGWQAMAWTAWDDDLGADASPYGYGPTEADAIRDLLEKLEIPA